MQHDPGDPAGPRRDPHDAPPDPVEPDTIRRHLETLARPRMTGSEGARTVEAEIRDRFRLAGYETTALGCSFSTLPGVYGLPAAGASLVVMAAGSAWALASGQPLTALVVLVAGILVAALPLLLLGPAMRLPWRRVETANLLFTRGTPRWIVMAHRDSKSQRAPTLVRTLALAAAVVAWGALVALAAVGVAGGAAGPACALAHGAMASPWRKGGALPEPTDLMPRMQGWS